MVLGLMQPYFFPYLGYFDLISRVDAWIASQSSSHSGLALLGCAPAFPAPLRTGAPNVLDPEAVVALVRQALDRNWLTNDGPLVHELEGRFAEFQGVSHAVAVSSATAGLCRRLRRIRNYGFVAEDTVSILGTNAKMNEFCAAMALANLARYERLHEHDDAIHEAYRMGLDGLPGITLAECRAGDSRCHHYAVIEVSDSAPIRREALRAVLAAEQVTARRYFKPGCHRSPPYSAHEPRHPLPVTERLSRSLLQLPTGVQLSVEDALRIAAIVTMACEECGRVEQALAREGVACATRLCRRPARSDLRGAVSNHPVAYGLAHSPVPPLRSPFEAAFRASPRQHGGRCST